MNQKIKCPYCGYEGETNTYKELRKPWKFRFYEVKRLQCPKCGGIFQHYIGTSPKGKKSEYTIRIKPKPKK
ncbi:MAG: hypothetical protein B7O98_01485 [Zestosphaera tikiterensis]|uniref:Uncharacterized protein n=1 Tax=Zestosphaera tikiterensis TaxID=1973259 RepID=A0A2R7Y6W9_9CREN|nr:MAG: hypothetical protein B7O98_01485 [Zestosphaera tikiterensis]